ncbi:CS domain protein [Aphelenchoides besseyi]|nr:CS domain protein [Aphelenchoides besseyi]
MATAGSTQRNPTILWAQRKELVYLTVEVEKLNMDELKCDGNKFSLKGSDSTTKFDVELEFFDNVNWDDHKRMEKSRYLVLVIPKTEQKWWPQLLKKAGKVPWIKVDFDKWVDEDEAADEKEGVDSFFKQIYKNLDEDGRRAMAKSYSESAGTVLSTNWKDVGQKKVEVKPPDGVEHKQYEK